MVLNLGGFTMCSFIPVTDISTWIIWCTATQQLRFGLPASPLSFPALASLVALTVAMVHLLQYQLALLAEFVVQLLQHHWLSSMWLWSTQRSQLFSPLLSKSVSLKSLYSKIISCLPAPTPLLGGFICTLLFQEFGLKTSTLLSWVFVYCWVCWALKLIIFRPLYPPMSGIRTGLIHQVPVPEMWDVIFLHLSSLHQKKN